MPIPISVVDVAAAHVVWKNTTAEPAEPEMRYDIRQYGGTVWTEGTVVKADLLGVEGEGSLDLECEVPDDWANVYVDARLIITGVAGTPWQNEQVYVIGTPTEAFEIGSLVNAMIVVMMMTMMMQSMEGAME